MQVNKNIETEMEPKTLELLDKENMPLSIGFVAFNLKITWQTARALLLKLSLTGKITALETSKGYMFQKKQHS
jgi:hypothetical protein